MRQAAEASPIAPEQRLADGFASHLAAWALTLGADDATRRILRETAAALSLATSGGDVCLMVDEGEAAPPAGQLKSILLASGVVGTPQQPGAMPLILDDDGRFYLHRYFDYERRLAARLVRAASAPPFDIDAATRRRLHELFAANEAALGGSADWQKLAAALALRGRLTVISGGPGTGKTTTVVNLLACLLAQNPAIRIALAAPTGKAAARMTEAIRQRAAHLPLPLRSRLPTDASTVHRLLGVTPAAGGFVHHAGNPLPIDALVVDEASMLDLALATRLLEAVPDRARIILLGDKDQLSAVEAGAVFGEISADPALSEGCRSALAAMCEVDGPKLNLPAQAHPSPLADTVVWFDRNFRFAADSGIGRLAADINRGRAPHALEWLRAGSDDSVRWLDDALAQPGDATWQCLAQGYAAYFDAVRRDRTDKAAITRCFNGFRALCAVRDGPRGVQAFNDRMTRHAREILAPARGEAGGIGSPWFVGRPVMVLRNDPVQKLFNGDIGIALPDDAGELMVYFPDGERGFRAVAPLRLPEHQTAFAMTVHKAQGSEFDAVLVVLPQGRSRVATRELLYTAVTRARARVTLACGADILGAAIESPTRRRSGLLARLREADRASGRSA